MTSPSAYLRRALVVSLLVNIFLVGGLGGGVYHWFASEHAREAAASQRPLQRAIEDLPEARRKQLQDLLKQARVERQASIKAAHEARIDLYKQMRAPSLDRAAMLASLDKVRENDDIGRVIVDKTVTDFILTLSPQERDGFTTSLYPRIIHELAQQKGDKQEPGSDQIERSRASQ